jgi:ribose 5-phosphate isomerase B
LIDWNFQNTISICFPAQGKASEESMSDKETRDKIKGLVRQALDSRRSETGSASKTTETKVELVRVNSLSPKGENGYERDESAKDLITEDDLRGLNHGDRVRISSNARLTPSAQDFISANAIELVPKSSRNTDPKIRTVGIGCDHGGFETKERLKSFLSGRGFMVRDFGTDSKDAVDYPDFAHAVARAVSDKTIEVGIMVDGAGIGSAMTANKVPGVRAAACYSVALAKNSREHNGANLLTLGSGQNSFDEICEITFTFLTTEISESRHKKRVGKIDAIDREYKK